MISGETILNKLNILPSNDIKPELKKEHELNTNDRMHLINNDIDDTYKIETLSQAPNDSL